MGIWEPSILFLRDSIFKMPVPTIFYINHMLDVLKLNKIVISDTTKLFLMHILFQRFEYI